MILQNNLFMDNEIKTWLFDILQSIEEIESYFPKGEKKFKNFTEDIRTKRAVERNLEIIGEAVNRVLNKDGSIEISNARKIIATRNKIIHGYDKISEDIIWGIVVNHLPKLKEELKELMKD